MVTWTDLNMACCCSTLCFNWWCLCIWRQVLWPIFFTLLKSRDRGEVRLPLMCFKGISLLKMSTVWADCHTQRHIRTLGQQASQPNFTHMHRTHTINVHIDLFYKRPSLYAHTPVIPVTSGISDEGQLYTNTLRVNPLCLLFVTLTLLYGCTLSNSQRSSNIFHVIEDTMRPLYPERERECESETVISLSEDFLPAVAVCLSAPVSPSGCFGRQKEGRKEGKREGKKGWAYVLCLWGCGSSKGKKKGDWSEFENSNQPIGEADVEKKNSRERNARKTETKIE